jgi:hypothetical protein
MGGIDQSGAAGINGTDAPAVDDAPQGSAGPDAGCTNIFSSDTAAGRGGEGDPGGDGGNGGTGREGQPGKTFELHVTVLGSGWNVDVSGGKGGDGGKGADGGSGGKGGVGGFGRDCEPSAYGGKGGNGGNGGNGGDGGDGGAPGDLLVYFVSDQSGAKCLEVGGRRRRLGRDGW